MLIFYSVILVLFFITYFYRKWYIWELIISFLPYLCVSIFLIVISNIIIGINKLITKSNVIYYFIFLVLFCILLWFYIYEIYSFYNQKSNKDNSKRPIKVLYANIFANNSDYEDIEKVLEREKPDLILFTEFYEKHENFLIDFMHKSKIHLDKKNWTILWYWNAVYSKFPIINFNKNLWKNIWNYWFFQIMRDGQPYYFYLVHPNSPVSKDYYLKRNQQLKILWNDICKNHKKNDKIVMVWDFNTSPRSHNYKEFSSLIDWKLYNITRKEKIFFSWNLWKMLNQNGKNFSFIFNLMRILLLKFPILCHIDHAFVSKDISFQKFKKISFNDSDHDGFVFEIE